MIAAHTELLYVAATLPFLGCGKRVLSDRVKHKRFFSRVHSYMEYRRSRFTCTTSLDHLLVLGVAEYELFTSVYLVSCR